MFEQVREILENLESQYKGALITAAKELDLEQATKLLDDLKTFPPAYAELRSAYEALREGGDSLAFNSANAVEKAKA